jgi:hypothetical protein
LKKQYILLSQNEALGEVYSKREDGTWVHQFLESDAQLEMPSIGFALPLNTLYENLPE